MSTFNPLRTESYDSFKAKISNAVAFRTKDKTRLYVGQEGAPQVCLAMFSEKIQSKADITADTVVGTFLNAAGEEVQVIYNPGDGKEAEFAL